MEEDAPMDKTIVRRFKWVDGEEVEIPMPRTGQEFKVPTPLPKTDGRKDHIIPEGFLRGFVDPDRTEDVLAYYDVRSNKWKEKGVGGIGYCPGFYDCSGDEPGLKIADYSFSKLENGFWEVREDLRKTKFNSFGEHLPFLLSYLQMLRARSRLFFEESPAPTKDHTIALMVEEIKEGPGWAKLYDWGIRYVESPACPFVIHDQVIIAEGERQTRVEGLLHHATLLWFPLCWDACLVGSPLPSRFDTRIARFCDEDVRTLQRKYKKNAKLFFVSPRVLDI